MHDPISTDKLTSSYEFGFEVMGPILAECCFLLHEHLKILTNVEEHSVLYCARGGLVIKRALDIYLASTEQKLSCTSHDFMVSRLAASRLALNVAPGHIEPYLSLEFRDRSCAEVAKALTGENIVDTGLWSEPYNLDRLLYLFDNTEEGAIFRHTLTVQANLFREHFLSIANNKKIIHIVDTGVFGSIGHFIQVAFPDIKINSILLFHANYKAKLPSPSNVLGLVCNEDRYSPWNVRTSSRLYWPFIESFFEPNLPSVRNYKVDSTGEIICNLQTENWEENLYPTPGTIRDGAFDYLTSLNTTSLSQITKNSLSTWKDLRKKIILPKSKDLELMGVKNRGLDFGFDDTVTFAANGNTEKFTKQLRSVNESVWSEGKLRELFPNVARVFLYARELNRCFLAIVTMLKKLR